MPKALKTSQSLLGAGPGPARFLAALVDEVGFFEGAISMDEALEAMAESAIEEPEYLLSPAPETADYDGDGVTDGADNCPSVSNSDQADVDMDGIGDACEPPDADGDDVPDASDNCPYEYNPEQVDSNGDGIGDECVGMPPDVETGAATNVTGSSATLNGTVDPEASETTYQFEYGTTAAYGSKVPLAPASAGAGASPVVVSVGWRRTRPTTTAWSPTTKPVKPKELMPRLLATGRLRRHRRGQRRGRDAHGAPVADRTLLLALARHALAGERPIGVRAQVHRSRLEPVHGHALALAIRNQNRSRDPDGLLPAGGRSSRAGREGGGTVSAWTNTGTEFTQILAAADSSFDSGYTGVEASGNFTRLSNFRSGTLSPFSKR
jgi:hypothetical protein